MAGEIGARLQLVHVVPPATDPSLGSAALTRLGRQLGKGLAVELAPLSGRPAREITAYARDKAIDLVCETSCARIRGEAFEHKIETERAGRRGSSA